MAIQFTDPLFDSQWYLVNNGQRGSTQSIDLNVMPAWQLGFNGSGIRVAINDDGMDLTHPDLAPNIELSSVFDTGRELLGAGFEGTSNQHGTVVGSIVGMASNYIGGVGVAYKSTLIPAYAMSTVTNADAKLFAANLAARADVSVNSWGSDPAFTENFGPSGAEKDQAWGAELLRAATVGRNGLGMVIEVSAGNERENRADAALSNFTGNKVTISVAAVDEAGRVTSYSTPGANNLVSAFGGVSSAEQSVNTGFGAVAADIQSTSGYNETSGTAGDYSYQNEGTSYSGPMVGGAAALMLQANPGLGFRDVSAILAMTARQTDTTNASWVTNGSTQWNLGGMHFSRDYGYGVVDIAAAVRLAQSWADPAATVSNWVKAESGPMIQQVRPIPDNEAQSLSVTTQVTDNLRIDRMEFDLSLSADSPSELKAEITSPFGTTVTFFDRPLARPLKDGVIDPEGTETPWPGSFTIGSTAFLGESSAGTWTLKLTDLVTGNSASFNQLIVRAWGSPTTDNNQCVFTDEYPGGRALEDKAGTDTLNAAAVSKNVIIDLSGATTSQVGTANLRFSPGSSIEHVIGGAGADILIGNASANRLRGNQGNDTLNGGEGVDTAIFNGSRSQYTLAAQGSTSFVTTDSIPYRDGVDSVSAVERFQFSDLSVAVDLDGNAGQVAKILGAIFGISSVANKTYVGIGLGLLDSGVSYEKLADLAVSVTGKSSSSDVCTLLWVNLVGSEPTAADIGSFVSLLDSGQMTIGYLATLAADTSLNASNINLVGLSQTGLEFI